MYVHESVEQSSFEQRKKTFFVLSLLQQPRVYVDYSPTVKVFVCVCVCVFTAAATRYVVMDKRSPLW